MSLLVLFSLSKRTLSPEMVKRVVKVAKREALTNFWK
jgi:hypothetical protein